MISNFLFSNTKISLIKTSLDASMMRHTAISNNIANVNTPNFKKQEVRFEDELSRAMETGTFKGRTTNPLHIPIGGNLQAESIKPKMVTIGETSMRNDGNNVDIDEEMSNLSKNTINYRTLASALEGELTKISTTITKAARV